MINLIKTGRQIKFEYNRLYLNKKIYTINGTKKNNLYKIQTL